MRKIKELDDWIDEELCSAKCYAEKYVDYKVNGDSSWSSKFKTMANSELEHASILFDLRTNECNKLKEACPVPDSMVEKFERFGSHYVEKTAWIKQILSM